MDPTTMPIFGCGQCGGDVVSQKHYLRGATPICQNCYETIYSKTCRKCATIIEPTTKSYTLSDWFYHEQCFVCSLCRKGLHGEAVQLDEATDNLMCSLCWEIRYGGVCAGCAQPFKKKDEKIDFCDRQFHERCFMCKGCKQNMGDGHVLLAKNEHIYCEKCYVEQFLKTCHKCQDYITTGGITVKELPFHDDCFRCVVCDDELRKQTFFYVEEDRKGFICTACYLRQMSKQCEACQCAIATSLDQTFMCFEHRYWHRECFNCDSCSQTLVDQSFSAHGTKKDKLVCKSCAASSAKRNSIVPNGASNPSGGLGSRRSSIFSSHSLRINNGGIGDTHVLRTRKRSLQA